MTESLNQLNEIRQGFGIVRTASNGTFLFKKKGKIKTYRQEHQSFKTQSIRAFGVEVNLWPTGICILGCGKSLLLARTGI